MSLLCLSYQMFAISIISEQNLSCPHCDVVVRDRLKMCGTHDCLIVVQSRKYLPHSFAPVTLQSSPPLRHSQSFQLQPHISAIFLLNLLSHIPTPNEQSLLNLIPALMQKLQDFLLFEERDRHGEGW